jgi:hypothetical protein
VPSDADTKTYLAAMKQYQPSANVGAFAPTSFEAIVDLQRALLTVKDPKTLNAKSISDTLGATKDVKLFMGGGQTFSCGATLFAASPSVCTGAAFLVSYDAGTYKLIKGYDASTILK